MADEFSPEEKLLHLIKGKQDSAVPAAPEAKEPKAQAVPQEDRQALPGPDKVPGDSKEVQSKDTVLQSVNALNPAVKAYKNARKSKSTFNANYLIFGAFIIIVLLTGYFIFNALIYKEDQEVENLKLLIESFSKTEGPVGSGAEKAPPVKKEDSDNKKPASSFEDYQKLLDKKAIFAPPARSSSKAKETEGPGLPDLVKDLNLVGIIPGNHPQVIIEDKRNGQTLFLKKGETINYIRVKNIQNGRVVLEHNDETVTLSL